MNSRNGILNWLLYVYTVYVYVCVLGEREGERFIFSIFVLGLFSANITTKLHQAVIHGDIVL